MFYNHFSLNFTFINYLKQYLYNLITIRFTFYYIFSIIIINIKIKKNNYRINNTK